MHRSKAVSHTHGYYTGGSGATPTLLLRCCCRWRRARRRRRRMEHTRLHGAARCLRATVRRAPHCRRAGAAGMRRLRRVGGEAERSTACGHASRPPPDPDLCRSTISARSSIAEDIVCETDLWHRTASKPEKKIRAAVKACVRSCEGRCLTSHQETIATVQRNHSPLRCTHAHSVKSLALSAAGRRCAGRGARWRPRRRLGACAPSWRPTRPSPTR